jgi:Ca-activated chloride channel family protein
MIMKTNNSERGADARRGNVRNEANQGRLPHRSSYFARHFQCPALWVTVAALLLGLLGGAGIARADGLIVIDNPPEPRPGHFSFAPLEVVYHRVTVEIKDQVAITTVDQEFYNPNGRQLEGTYLFPLPAGAHIDQFSMDVNGEMTEAELLDAAKARAIYEEIVRRHRDPALLEYVGRDVFKARIFPIEPNSKKQVKLKYTQLLTDDSGLVEYTYSLNTEKFSAAPLKDVSIKVDLSCSQPIKSIYSPSHAIDIRRDGNQRAVIGYEEKDVRPDTDFKLIFSHAPKEIGLDVLSYQAGTEDGYFMLLASPGLDDVKEKVQNRDICFVIDTSGSMAGPKLDQAKKALLFCLANLNEGDRFEIIRFSTESESLFGKLTAAEPANVEAARDFVNAMKPIGGTAIQDALLKASSLPGAQEAPFTVIFLTDGQPTIGETDEEKLIGSLTTLMSRDLTRVFSFGIGTDINTQLLDRISGETRAFTQYVLPEEDIEVKVSNFYTKIKSPALTNVKFDFTGEVRIKEIYPAAMSDLYKGQTLVAFGRYSPGKPNAAIRLTGTLNGEAREFVTDVKLAENDTANAFIPRLWAVRRVGWLLDEIRLRGETTELKDEVVRLARDHGIVTPYTAYLIIEDEEARRVPLAQRTMREFESDAASRAGAEEVYDSARLGARQEKSGRRAVENSAAAQSLKEADNEGVLRKRDSILSMPKSVNASPSDGYRNAMDYNQQVRAVNGKTFYQNGATWTDSASQAQKNLKRREVQFNSGEYFALLDSHPLLAQWLSLGSEIDVVMDDVLYVIR